MSTDISNFDRLQGLLPELFQSNQSTGKSYLQAQLTNQTPVLLSMESVQESLLVKDREITLIPNMPTYFLGLINSRDRVFGLIDLPKLLGLSNQTSTRRRVYHTIVIRVNDISVSEQELLVGFVFFEIQSITRIIPSQLNLAQDRLSQVLKPYVQYCVQEQENLIPVLDINAIINNIITS